MTSTKSLQIELVTKYDTKEGGGGWESKSAKGDPYLLADLNRGALNPLWQQDEVSSHLKYYQLSSEILD